jgi:hypothetical protein
MRHLLDQRDLLPGIVKKTLGKCKFIMEIPGVENSRDQNRGGIEGGQAARPEQVKRVEGGIGNQCYEIRDRR